MSIWDVYSDDELLVILDCDNFGEVKRRMRRRFDKDACIRAARETYHLVRLKTMTLASVFYPVSAAASASMLVLLAVIGSITVAFLPLTIMTAVLASVGLASGIFFMAASYLKQKIEKKKHIKELDFNAVQLLCADELLQRKTMQLATHDRQSALLNVENDHQPFRYQNKHKIEKVEPAVAFGILTASTFFATLYCGLAITFNAFGAVALSAALLGPIGMSVALAVSIGIGIFCAYKHYQALVREDTLQQFKDYQHEQVKDKRYQYEKLDKRVNNRLERAASAPLLSLRQDVRQDHDVELTSAEPHAVEKRRLL